MTGLTFTVFCFSSSSWLWMLLSNNSPALLSPLDRQRAGKKGDVEGGTVYAKRCVQGHKISLGSFLSTPGSPALSLSTLFPPAPTQLLELPVLPPAALGLGYL